MAKFRSSLLTATTSTLGDREVRVVASTSAAARDGHVLVAEGARLSNYRANPIVLWQHDPEQPVGRSTSIAAREGKLVADIEFAPPGISTTSDTICGLVKSGVITTLSVGFDPLDGEPLDPKSPRGGQRFTDWELLEISFCSVPVDTGAVVIGRSFGPNGYVPNSRDEVELITAAAENGEALSAARIAHLVHEARQLGVTAAYRYRWLHMVRRQVEAADEYLYAVRQADLQRLWPK